MRHDDSRPDDDWYSGLRGGRSEQPPAGAPRHGEWSGSAGGSPADGGRRGAAEPYAGGYRHSSGGSGGYDSGGYDSGGYDSGGYGRPEPGLGGSGGGGYGGGYGGVGSDGYDGYDGDRTSGLYGGGYGGYADPGDAAAARRALEGGDPLGPAGPGGPGGPGGPRGPGGPTGPGYHRRRGRRPGRGKRILKITGLVALVALVLGFGGVGLLYARTDVPDPRALETNQVASILYADGKSVLARIGSQNRTDVPLTTVPQHVRYAVLAAENRSFYTDPGISPKGITRAAWNNVRGGELQGGSTITQQYVKNVFTSGDRTFSRKFKELFVTVKLDRQYSKDQILEWYLNTIYFGRGAYGIQAAAEVYFGKPVGKLTVGEGAVLASSIRSPALYDPQAHPEAAKARWRFVLDGMVEMDKLAAATAAQQKYPAVRKKTSVSLDDANKTWKGLIVRQVTEELEAANFDEARLNSEGLRVVTTIDRKAQAAAVAAVREQFEGQPRNLRQALVAVKPEDGGVLAYYGGSSGTGFDYAQAWRQPGSSFKPYTLAAALQQSLDPETPDEDKVSLYRVYDGSSPREFPGAPRPVRNSEGAQCPRCSVLEAMRRSVNTVFYQMALDVGPDNVAKLAHRMSVPAKRTDNDAPTLTEKNGTTAGGIGIGQYEVRTIDQAAGFAVFASGGVRHPAHFVTRVLDRAGNVVYENGVKSLRALDPKVANDVTYSMKPIAAASDDPLADGRESAAKTGTQQLAGSDLDNSDAWMVGFTPQVSTAVWVGTDGYEKVRNAEDRPVYGRGLPGETWQAFMNAYLEGTPAVELTDDVQVHPELRPTPSPTATRPSPTPTPSPTPSPTATRKRPNPRPTPSEPSPSPTEPAPTSPTPKPTKPSPTPPGTT